VLTWTQLRIQQKPCGLLNVDGYYDPLLAMFDHATKEGFLRPEHRSLIVSDTKVDRLLERLHQFTFPSSEKWLQKRPAP
ncbi:MAG: LOG family protein, partial [Bryobacteraceae bacterium]